MNTNRIFDVIATQFSNVDLDVFNLISFILTVVGGGLALYQWHVSLKIRRSEFIKEIIEHIRFDESLVEAMRLIDYNKKWYDGNFHTSPLESKMDKYISYLSYVCYLKEKKLLSEFELKFLNYPIIRALHNEDMQEYLKVIHNFARKNGCDCAFTCLLEYGEKNNYIIIEKDANGIINSLRTKGRYY